MKPIPAHDFADAGRPFASALPSPPPRNESPSNFRRSASQSNRAYPFLLIASTLIASAFCFLYMTKPVVTVSAENQEPAPAPANTGKPALAAAEKPAPESPSLLPGNDRLPGDPTTAAAPARKDLPAFEETNLSVQHVLTARTPEGDLSRIDLDVPVLYQSRHLRWTEDDVSRARDILSRLSHYQEKSLALRSEGSLLLAEWNQLMARSIPSAELRADSPSLPVNQRGSSPAITPESLDSSQTIQLKTPGK